MKSAWLIKFKNGYKVILSENNYKRYEKETPKKDVLDEQHWFSMGKCISKNPEVNVLD